MKPVLSIVFAHTILTDDGYRTVAELVAEMQAEGTPQLHIDRWLQGIERNLRQQGRLA